MTVEQKVALGKVRAAYSQGYYHDVATGLYQTADVGLTLDVVGDLLSTVDSIREDLEELKMYLEMDHEHPDVQALELVNSSLLFLNTEE